jgi:hypothetical protein
VEPSGSSIAAFIQYRPRPRGRLLKPDSAAGSLGQGRSRPRCASLQQEIAGSCNTEQRGARRIERGVPVSPRSSDPRETGVLMLLGKSLEALL